MCLPCPVLVFVVVVIVVVVVSIVASVVVNVAVIVVSFVMVKKEEAEMRSLAEMKRTDICFLNTYRVCVYSMKTIF